MLAMVRLPGVGKVTRYIVIVGKIDQAVLRLI